MHIANVLAGIKLVIAAGFVAYVIEFARSLAVGREVDRQTLEVVLIVESLKRLARSTQHNGTPIGPGDVKTLCTLPRELS